jgi:hypothetical protein
MKKEEFIEKRDSIKIAIKEKQGELMELEQDYITSNQEFPVGSKVKLTFPDDNSSVCGYIRGYEILFDEVRPQIAKINANGTMHKTHNFRVSWWEKPIVELCEE